jgi:LysM repeat protein
MKKIQFVMAPIFSLIMAMGCKSAPAAPAASAAPIAPAVPAVSTASTIPDYYDHIVVYDKSTGLILDGAKEYTVKRGDTLSGIARHETGNGFYYPIIMLSSRGTVVNPDKIEPGMKLTIPDIAKNKADENAKERMKNCLLDFANAEKFKNEPNQRLIDGLKKEAEKL